MIQSIRFHKVKRYLLLYVSLVVGIELISWGMSPWFKLGINTSSSVDGLVFVIFKSAEIHKGDLVAFYPPENRFYRHVWFVKYALGVGGDMVTKQGRDFFLNGKYIGTAKEKSLKGEELSAAEGGRIGHGEYFVWTKHFDSFDSRYADIGNIKSDAVIGRAVRLF